MLDKAAIRRLRALANWVNAHATISRDDSLINKKLPEELLLRYFFPLSKGNNTRIAVVVFRIFSYLDIVSLCRCAQVCRTWNVLALDGSNWQNVDLFQFQKDIKVSCAFLFCLQINSFPFKASVVENLAKRCGGFLKKLSLRGCESVQDGALETFARKCSFIEELNLEKCKRLTDRSCESLGSNCKRIQVLNLDCVSGVTQKGLKFISDGCLNLECLNISWCNHVTDDGLAAIARNCRRLRTLICKGCTGLTDDGLKYVGESCSDLRVLNLQSCSHLTDQGIQYVAAGCHRLEYLCLSMCSRITDRSLQAISMGCQLLNESLICSLLTDSGFHALAKNCHDLERMDLEDCSLAFCRCIQADDICRIAITQITDQTLAHLSAGCGSLIELSLSHCELITDEGIRTLALSLGALDNLTVLELDNCPLITDQALDSLRECRALKRLELYDCQQVSRGGIRRFKQVAPNVMVHAYFAPATPPVHQRRSQRRYCRCCIII
ncbi:f box:lrr repeat protein [Trichuris trichiura]|uniref:F box:lrr repeat protein n=1 Tax=Trichuris trichiura TaxID=36087 RepID=A0A077ZGG5_TRITR|nr:f box:lrr repeat protein [Trichuris trichiura]